MNRIDAEICLDSFPVQLTHLVKAIVRQELDQRIGSNQAHGGRVVERLSGREREVLTLLANGYNRNEISRLLSIRYNTVSSHIANIYCKLSVSSIAEATQVAMRSGLA